VERAGYHRTADERLFVEKCGMCHRQMGMGKRESANMPRISRGELSESQLTRIAAYLAKARVQ
jgi:cytochrome c553